MNVVEAYHNMIENDFADCERLECNYWKKYLNENPTQKENVVGLYEDLAAEDEHDLSNDEDDYLFRQALEYRNIAEWIKVNC